MVYNFPPPQKKKTTTAKHWKTVKKRIHYTRNITVHTDYQIIIMVGVINVNFKLVSL